MKAAEIFAQGYAVQCYDIRNNVRQWRYGGEGHSEARLIELPADAVPLHDLDGIKFQVAKWDDVRKAANG